MTTTDATDLTAADSAAPSRRRYSTERAVLSGDSLVVMCASNNWDTTPMMDRHIAPLLARTGPVLYVDPPLSHLTSRNKPALAESARGPRLRVLGPNLLRYTPRTFPGPTRPGLVRLTAALVGRRLRKVVDDLGLPVHALLTAWPLIDVEGALEEDLTVFWAQDDWSGGADLLGVDGERLARGEQRLAASSDVVIAANPAVAERWSTGGRQVELIPYGCDAPRFAGVDAETPAADVLLPSPIVGVVAQINGRTDLSLLEAVADRGRSLLLVGPYAGGLDEARFKHLTDRPNVQWVGSRPFDAIASYLRLIDVGLVPYADTAFNRGSFPLKLLEYLAAGRRVVTTDLPAARWLASDLVSIASGPDVFADAVDAALATPRSGAEVAARQAFATDHSWECRADEMARVIGREPA